MKIIILGICEKKFLQIDEFPGGTAGVCCLQVNRNIGICSQGTTLLGNLPTDMINTGLPTGFFFPGSGEPLLWQFFIMWQILFSLQ